MLYKKSPGWVSHCRVSGLHLRDLVEAKSVNPYPYIHRYTITASLSVAALDTAVWGSTGCGPHRLTVTIGKKQRILVWGSLTVVSGRNINIIIECLMQFVKNLIYIYHRLQVRKKDTLFLTNSLASEGQNCYEICHGWICYILQMSWLNSV